MKSISSDPACEQCKRTHYGHKAVCYEHLTAFESVTMAVVAVLSVSLGTIWTMI